MSDEIQRLLDIWLYRLREAELKLRVAQERLHAAIANVRPGCVEDGLSEFRQASQEEVQALREYERMLRIVTDLVEHGKIPDEEE